MTSIRRQSVAVVGAGIAEATIVRSLVLAGHAVHVFDKSCGPGGRLVTRRVDWDDQNGHARTTRLDHGAIGITARCAAFQAFVDLARHEGRLAAWKPKLAAGSLLLEGGTMLYLPTPDMPALCRHLLDGTTTTWSYAVDGLHNGPLGWQVQAGGVRHALKFDSVVLALPPRRLRHCSARTASTGPGSRPSSRCSRVGH